MQGLPDHGSKVKAWPMPGRKAQMDERPVDKMGGGRFIPNAGAVVEWSPFMHGQLLAGALLLHPPPCEKHDHGDQGQDDCKSCGRTVEEAQKYDVHFADGKKVADAAAKSLPKHPYELGLHPHSDALKKLRDKEAGASDVPKPTVLKSAPAANPDLK